MLLIPPENTTGVLIFDDLISSNTSKSGPLLASGSERTETIISSTP